MSMSRGNCTLAMIVRDEAANLPACLESVRGLFRDTVVVDTGSTDDTVAIARSFGARVFSRDWIDDFSDARNFGLDQIKGGSVFRIDADDRLPADQYRTLQTLLGSLRADEPRCWAFRVHSIQHTGDEVTCDEVRMWRSDPRIRFHGRIHERIRPEDDAPDVLIYSSGVHLHHVGYDTRDKYFAKLRRNLDILEQVLLTPPIDALTYFDAARTDAGLGGHDRALELFEHFFRTRDPKHSLASRVAHRRICELQLTKKDMRAAVLAAQRGLREYPDDQVLVSVVASAMAQQGLYDLAREGFERSAALCDAERMDSGISVHFLDRINAALAALPPKGSTHGSSPTHSDDSGGYTPRRSAPDVRADAGHYVPRGPAPVAAVG